MMPAFVAIIRKHDHIRERVDDRMVVSAIEQAAKIQARYTVS